MKRIIFVSIGLVLLMGCSGKRNPNGSVSGTIRYNGKPVNGATLHLHLVSDEKEEVTIPVTQEGTFTAANVPPGEYKIVVQALELSKERKERLKGPEIPKGMDPAKAAEMQQRFQQAQGGEVSATIPYPKKYKSVKETDLKCTIAAGKDEKLSLELKD